MEHKLTAGTMLALAVFAAGCKPSPEQERKATAEQITKLQEKTAAAAREMKDYTYAQKAALVAKMQGQLAEINRDLDQLNAKLENASGAAKAEARPKLKALRDQTAKLNKQLDKARNASESTWDDVKTSFKQGIDELKEGFQKTRQRVSDKIAP